MNVPKPYQGKDKFIFISYSHRDTAKVFPIIFKLMENGYRVWYDQGIDPGTEWDENIATHIDTCGYFIAFMSSNYLGSNNCKDELNYARDLEKDRLIVYLEEVTLPAGMAMRVNRLQSIFKYTYTNEADFYEKLFAASNIDVCLGEKTAQQKQTPDFASETKKAEPAFNPIINNNTGAGGMYNGQSMNGYSQPYNQQGQGYNPQGTYGGYANNSNVNNGGFNPQNAYNNQGYNAAKNGDTNTFNTFSAGNPNDIKSATLPVKNKVIAAVLALMLGSFGAHKFYLGKKLQGIIMAVLFWTYIPGIIGVIDAIVLLTMTDENFMKKYKCRIN